MSKIEEMIKELCPEGVEKVKLGEVCASVFAGGTPSTSRDDYYDGDIPWIRSGEIDFNRIFNAERNITDLGLANSSAKMIKSCSVVMAMTGATVAKVATVEIETSANQSVCALETDKNIMDYRYLYYYLSTHYHDIKGSAQGALTSLNLQMIKALQIPLPPLSIQQEIVSVLDSFTTLIDKMKHEVEKRKKQMEYYREKLLTFEEGECEWKKLDALTANDCPISYGIVQPGDGVDDGVPVVRPVDMISSIVHNTNLKKTTKEISDSYKKTILKGGELLICVRGTTGITSIAGNDLQGCNVTRGIVPLWFNETIISKYMFFCFNSNGVQDDIENKTNGAGLRQINVKDLKQIMLPIPSLSHQREIVSTLDKFESYISKLEKMIALRQKQYEYYREQLLTFE